MKTAFFAVMLIIAFGAAIDITTDTGRSGKKDDASAAGALGFAPRKRKTDSLILFAITTAALVAALILEVLV